MKKIPEQFFPVIIAKMPDNTVAGRKLGFDKVKKGIIHIEHDSPDGYMKNLGLHRLLFNLSPAIEMSFPVMTLTRRDSLLPSKFCKEKFPKTSAISPMTARLAGFAMPDTRDHLPQTSLKCAEYTNIPSITGVAGGRLV
jgi:hypothetical protein